MTAGVGTKRREVAVELPAAFLLVDSLAQGVFRV